LRIPHPPNEFKRNFPFNLDYSGYNTRGLPRPMGEALSKLIAVASLAHCIREVHEGAFKHVKDAPISGVLPQGSGEMVRTRALNPLSDEYSWLIIRQGFTPDAIRAFTEQEVVDTCRRYDAEGHPDASARINAAAKASITVGVFSLQGFNRGRYS